MSDNQGSTSSVEALELIEKQNYADALILLKQHVSQHPDGQSYGLLAVAHFQLEEYGSASENYEAALKYEPDNQNWRDMLEVSKANVIAEVHVFVPDAYYFDRDQLLAKPTLREGALPPSQPPGPAPGMFRQFLVAIGNAAGVVATLAMNVLTRLVGKIFGYRDEVWTNWYRRRFILSILSLAHMREQLNKNNLKTTYPSGTLVGFQAEGQSPPEGVTHSRTADGSWNNLSNPKEGAAGTRFPRNVDNRSIRPEMGDELMTPNPREISRTFLTREWGMKEVPFLNLLAASWINFQNHDWIHHGETLLKDVHEIPLAEEDPAREKYRQTKMRVPKTQPDPTYMNGNEETPITFINEVTHWWDGSQIYGSDQETVNRIRSGVHGKLTLNEDNTPPLGEKGIEESGFTRNWWVGLAMLHTLFVREHNAICDHLHEAYPVWDDNRLFNVARLMNAAVMAKIHSVEWTPAILPNRALDSGLNANWYGLLTNVFKIGKNRKTVADINVRNPEMGGVVGNPINKHGQPFGLTEEFTEVYRLHSLLPETIQIRRMNGGNDVEEIPFVETRQAGSGKLTKRVGIADMFYSFGNQHPGALVLNNFPMFMQELSIPGNPLFDMGAVDILRARERGVPRYNEFRRQLGLNPIRSFDDLTDNKEQVEKLKKVYGDLPKDVEKLDLLIGTLGEEHRPTDFGFGETLFQIFILNATRRLQADRFYTDSYNEETYSKEGLRWIDDADLKTVLLRHYPELSNTGLANVKNAFESWDMVERLDKSRHPLRAFDRELKPDPWLARGKPQVPPGSSGLPLIGETLSYLKNSHQFFERRTKNYGPVFKTRLLGHSVVCFTGPEAFTFFANQSTFRREDANPGHVRELLSHYSLPLVDGPEHSAMRSLVLHAFRPEAIQRYLPVIEHITLDHLKRWEGLRTFAWVPEYRKLSASICSMLLLGKEQREHDDGLVNVLDSFMAGLTAFPIRLPWTKYGRALRSRNQLLSYIDEAIARHPQAPYSYILTELLNARAEDGKRATASGADGAHVLRRLRRYLPCAHPYVHAPCPEFFRYGPGA